MCDVDRSALYRHTRVVRLLCRLKRDNQLSISVISITFIGLYGPCKDVLWIIIPVLPVCNEALRETATQR